MWNNSLYGTFRTRSFSEIFPDLDSFKNEVVNSGINPLKIETLNILYYLLMSKFKNWTIAYSDENQFKLAMNSKIFMYGPTWEKRLEIQKELRELDEKDLLTGSSAIYNHAQAPGVAPSTFDTEELDYVSDQNVNKYRRSKLDAYEYLYDLLKVDVSKAFLDRFESLFNPFGQPPLPLEYEID